MKFLFSIIFCLLFVNAFSQSSDDILNLLIANKSITQSQADSLRAEAAIKQQDKEVARKSFFVNAARQLSLSGYTQIRYQQLDEKLRRDGFDIRRARIDLKGALTPYLSYRLQTEFADKPKIIDAYAEVKVKDYLIITAGQFKIPLSLENLTSSNKLEMIDRSMVVEALAARGKDVIGNQNGRDIGVQLSGTALKLNNLPFLDYRIGVFNGSGIMLGDTANEAKDVGTRFNLTPLKGLAVAVSYYNGWGRALKPDVPGRSQERDRTGFEASYVTSRISLKGEYLIGHDGITNRQGWYIQAGYFVIPLKLQVLGRYDTFDPNTDKNNNIFTNYTFGGNYNFNNLSRVQAFYTFRELQASDANLNYFSVQLQIGF
jgi:phosphate-selective porin OprO and OprP